MASFSAAEGILRCVYDGCLSGCDMGKERRPYHRNCGCALHTLSKNCQHHLQKSQNVSYPIRRSWSGLNLVLASDSTSRSPSPPSSPVEIGRMQNCSRG